MLLHLHLLENIRTRNRGTHRDENLISIYISGSNFLIIIRHAIKAMFAVKNLQIQQRTTSFAICARNDILKTTKAYANSMPFLAFFMWSGSNDFAPIYWADVQYLRYNLLFAFKDAFRYPLSPSQFPIARSKSQNIVGLHSPYCKRSYGLIKFFILRV